MSAARAASVSHGTEPSGPRPPVALGSLGPVPTAAASAARLAGIPPTIFIEMSALAVRTGRGQPRPGLPRRGRPAVGDRGGRSRRWRRAPTSTPPASASRPAPGDRAAPAAPLRHRARPRPRGRGHDRLHRGDRRGAARAGRPGRRGGRARALLRLLRRDARDGGRRTAPGDRCARPTSASTSTSLRAAVTDDPRLILLNTPAQPDRHRAHPRRAAGRRRPRAIEHDLVVITDEVYEHLVFDEHVARPDRDAARDVGAHADAVERRQVLLVHRLEGRLGDRAPPSWSGRCSPPSSG